MCAQHNVMDSAGDNTGQNINKGHTSNPRKEIKIPYPAGNRTRAAGLEGRDSDHATATITAILNRHFILPEKLEIELGVQKG